MRDVDLGNSLPKTPEHYLANLISPLAAKVRAFLDIEHPFESQISNTDLQSSYPNRKLSAYADPPENQAYQGKAAVGLFLGVSSGSSNKNVFNIPPINFYFC